jgi:hypothetical protein
MQGAHVDLASQEGEERQQAGATRGAGQVGHGQVGRIDAATVHQHEVARVEAAADGRGGIAQLGGDALRTVAALEDAATAGGGQAVGGCNQLRDHREARGIGGVLHRVLEAERAHVREAIARHDQTRHAGQRGTGRGCSGRAAPTAEQERAQAAGREALEMADLVCQL